MDWVYGQAIGFLGNFFALMGNMGVELFELEWVSAIILFFSRLAWALFTVSVVVCAFECGIEYSTGRGNLQQCGMNIIKGFLAVSLFTVVPVRLYALSVSLQGTFSAGLTGYGRSIGEVGQDIITELNEIQTLSDVVNSSHFGLGIITSPVMLLFCVILMGYAVLKVFFANLKRGGILLIQIAVGSLYMFSVPRGYLDGFMGWVRQVIGLCLTAFLQSTIEALITQPSAGVVLVNPDEQPFQFSDAVFVPFQPFPSDADLLTAFQPELFLHHCTEMCLMPQNVARHSLNVFQDYVAEYGFPDVMSTALVLVLLMERTVKERALRSVIVRRPLIQLLTAVGTVHQPGKDAASACTGIAMPLLAHLLYLLKHGFLDDDLMCIGEDGLLLKGIVPLLLVPDGVGIGLEVHRTARVLPPFQNRHNGTAVPVAGVLRFLVWGLDALQGPVCAGR